MKPYLYLIFSLFFITQKLSICQIDSTKTVVTLELKDGSNLVGHILSENDFEIQFITVSEINISVPKSQVINRSEQKVDLINGEIWKKNPNRTRMFFAPTGKALKAEKGYFSVYEIFFPFFAIGLTDYITLAGGFSLLPGADEQILYLAPKITPYESENISLSAGVLYLNLPNDDFDDDDNSAGILYGVSTYDFETAALTFGLGYGFSGGDVSDNPVIVLGWEARTSNSLKIISENWIFVGGETQLFSFGLRFFGTNLAADFGFVYPTSAGDDGFPFIPWLGFAYNF